MRSPFGKISWVSLLLVLIVVATIVAGMLVPGRTGTVIQTVGWIVLCVGVILEVRIRTTPLGEFRGDDRRPG